MQAMLRSDLPSYMVPFTTKDLTFIKPEVSKTYAMFGVISGNFGNSFGRSCLENELENVCKYILGKMM